MRKLILIDYSWLYNKYYYVAKCSFSQGNGNKKVLEQNLIRMLLQFLTLIKKSYPESKITLALDAPTSTLNNFKIFENYKQNRNKEEKKEVYSVFDSVLAHLVKTLEYKSFAFLRATGYEADQILAYVTKRYCETFEIIIFSGDKDLLQLSAYPNVFISDKFEKGSFIVKTDKEIFEKFKNSRGDNFTRISNDKKDILKYRTLKGDISDNLSPIYVRIKDKEIQEIIQNYWFEDDELSEDLIDIVIKRAEDYNFELAKKLRDNKKIWLRNYKIMDLFHIGNIKMKRLK